MINKKKEIEAMKKGIQRLEKQYYHELSINCFALASCTKRQIEEAYKLLDGMIGDITK